MIKKRINRRKNGNTGKWARIIRLSALFLIPWLSMAGARESGSQVMSLSPDMIRKTVCEVFNDMEQGKIKLTGVVVDVFGEPVTGANVREKGANTGTVTDINGNFNLEVSPGATLVVSYIGYNALEIATGSQTTLKITLTEDTKMLEEVVVVGYGVQKKINVVGAVTYLQGSELKSIPAASTSSAISGRLPGVTVIQQTGEPGNLGTRILVRGRTTLGDNSKTGPLIVIDGVQGRSMDEIDPNDIASLSVLKDASAAIYGAQAANGVILITTKQGEAGKPRLNYNFYQGFMTPSKVPEVCNAAEYATMLSEYQVNRGTTRTFTDEDIALFKSGIDPWEHPDTDWNSELIKQWTTATRHNLTIDGGFKGMTYYLSIGYKKDEAMYKQSSTSYDQYNVRAKLDFPIVDWLKANADIAAFETHRQFPFRSAADIIGAALRLKPTSPAFWPTGEPGPDVENGDNPVVTSSFAGGKNEQKTYRMQNSFKVSITPPFVKGLSLNAGFDYDITNYYRKRFFKPWTLYYPNWSQAIRDPVTGFVTDMPLTPTPRGLSEPRNEEDYQRTINITGNVNVAYARTFGDHEVTAYAGFEQYTSDYNDFGGYREGYISDLVQTMNAGANLNKNTYGSMTIYARRSWIGRVTYIYRSKYLAEVLCRRDGSLKFPPDSRWGNFPGFLLGWRISEEDFWKKHLSPVSYFKLKSSYGVMGMDPGNAYQYINKFSMASVNGMVFGTSSEIETTVGPPTIANPYITWETQTTYNVGFESKFLDNLFYLNFDYFYNKRDNILAPRNASVPSFTGLTLPDENIARVDNRGLEVEGGVQKAVNKDLFVGLSGNFSFNRNKVVFQDEPARVVPWQETTGHPYGATLMYEAIGIFRDEGHVNSYPHWADAQAGDIIFRDVSGDGQITSDDRILVDNTDAPEIFYGINLDITWKDFSLSALFQGQGKHLKRNVSSDDRRGEAGNYLKWMYDDRWTRNNQDASVPRPWSRADQYWSYAANISTFWYDNTAYLRLKNIVLTYNVPAKYYKSLGVSKIGVFLSGNNVALLYSATDKFDPEVDGIGVYPAMKTFAIGANINF
ncbi:MAG: TonB-dependent receptor [Tannerella sp.]|jgi:TonB-linked SusC/RagA family outer membrane protein|nr:TonB-dependent receptor [Tannerella sp.]